MRVYYQDLPSLKVGGPCIVMEETIAAGLNPAGPLVRFYFATVKSLPDGEPERYNVNKFGAWMSDAYADLSSPVGIDGYDFTEVQGWGPRSWAHLSGDIWMLPDTPEVRHLIHMTLHQEQKSRRWENVAAGRLSLFTDVLVQIIKSLTVPEPIRDFLKKHFPGAKVEEKKL